MINTEYLKELRLAKNLNKSQTAKLLSMTNSKYGNLENGKNGANIVTIARIAKYLGADLNKLLISA